MLENLANEAKVPIRKCIIDNIEVDPIDWTVEVEVKELFSVLLSLLKRGCRK
jgi:hypothetical protein